MTDDVLMTESELGQLTQRPRKTLQRWRLSGEGPPYIKLGRSVRYRRADVLAWLESQTVRPRAS